MSQPHVHDQQDLHTPSDLLRAYQLRFDQMAQTPYLNYPKVVHLETLVSCPAACSFCPYPVLTRKGTRMDDALIDKIIHELAAIPVQVPFQLFPFKVNEPFMEPRLFELMGKINRMLPNAQLSLVTSAAPLTEAKALQLNQVVNLQYLWLSVHESDPEAYTRLMQLPWERTAQRLQMLHRLKQEGQIFYPVVLARVGDGSAADQDFLDWGQHHYPLFKTGVYQRGDWLRQVSGEQVAGVSPDAPDISCLRWFELSITATGQVAQCCMDGQAEWPLGDVSQQHVLEVYNQAAYRRRRELALSRRGISPCGSCSFM